MDTKTTDNEIVEVVVSLPDFILFGNYSITTEEV